MKSAKLDGISDYIQYTFYIYYLHLFDTLDGFCEQHFIFICLSQGIDFLAFYDCLYTYSDQQWWPVLSVCSMLRKFIHYTVVLR